MRKFFLAVAVAAAAVLGSASTAEAEFRLRVESGTTTGPGAVITDDSAGDHQIVNDLNTMTTYNTGNVANVIGFSGSLGVFNLSVTTGTSTPFLQAPGFFEALDLNNVTLTATGGGTLRLILVRSDLGSNTPLGALEFRSDVGGVLTAAAGSSITFASYADNTNAIPNLGADNWNGTTFVNPISAVTGIGAGSPSTISQTFGVGAFGTSNSAASGFVNTTGTYSLYTVVTINFAPGGGSVSFNQTLGTTPAPAGLVLALTGLPALGLGAWIRRRRLATVTA